MDPHFHEDPNAEKAIDEFSNTVGENFIPPQRVAYDFKDALQPREDGFKSSYAATFAAAFAFALGLGHLLLGTPTERTAWQFVVMVLIAIGTAVGANLPVSPKEILEPVFTGLASGAWFFSIFAASFAFGSTTAAIVLGFLGLLAVAAFLSPAFKGYWAVAIVGLATLLSALGGFLGPISELNLALRGGIIGILTREFGTVFGGGGITDALQGQAGSRAFIVLPIIAVGLIALFFSASNRYLSSIIATTLTFVIFAGSPFTTNLNILVTLLAVILALVFAWRCIEQLDGPFVWIGCLTPALLVSAGVGIETGAGLINLIFVSGSLAALANLDAIVGLISTSMNKEPNLTGPNNGFNQQQQVQDGQFQQNPNQQFNPDQQFSHQAQPVNQGFEQAPQQMDQATTNPADQHQQFAPQANSQQNFQPTQDAFGRPTNTGAGVEQQNTIPAQDQTYVAGNFPTGESATFLTQGHEQPQTNHTDATDQQQYALQSEPQAQTPQQQEQLNAAQPVAEQHTDQQHIVPEVQAEQPVTSTQPTIEEIQATIGGNPQDALPQHRDSIQMPAEPNWYPDPRGQFEYRWFDGTNWTQYVSVGGEQIIDENPI